jgi:ubiquinone/menaquinone biosynthesis C-methylase UbiE
MTIGSALYTLKQRSVSAVLGPAAGLWHSFMGTHAKKGDPGLLQVIDRLHREALQQDYANAEAGLYPKSLLAPLPGWHDVRHLPEALRDLPSIYARKRRGDFHVGGADDAAQAHGNAAPGELPNYYLRAFHWQTDGWLSAHSARVYELQVEFLFFGTMDVMRRRALAALVRALGGDRRRMRVRILDVASGTGRFLEQAKAALPEATLEGVDLSPFYVERARRRLGRAARVRVANAEHLGGEGGVYDAVTCGFLFHELPSDARRRVLAECFRVLEPGGVLVVQDSMQRCDPNGKELEVFLDWFPLAYHEPYYKGYVDGDLADLLVEAGFRVTHRDHVLFSKLLVAEKPRTRAEA